MSDLDERDTVPAPPVPSTNPTAELRRRLDASTIAIFQSLVMPGKFSGVVIAHGIGTSYTPLMEPTRARQWLEAARGAAVRGEWIPTICRLGHIMDTPGMCGRCLRKEES